MEKTEQIIATMFDEEFGLTDLERTTPIFSEKILDSMDVLRLIMVLEKMFSFKIPIFEVSIDMFDTIASIAKLVEDYK